MKGKGNLIHGDCSNNKMTKLYRTLSNMKTRCYNPNYFMYKHYGGKGITICDDWMGADGFQNFKDWSYLNGYNESLSLDRIDGSKGYSPDNCRWVTMKEQQNNRSNNIIMTVNGETDTLMNMAKKYNIDHFLLRQRHNRGYSDNDAVFLKKWPKKDMKNK